MSLFTRVSLATAFALQVASAPLVSRSLSCPASNGSTYTVGGNSYTIECSTDRYMGDMPAPNGQHADTLEACIDQCQARTGCILVDYVPAASACYVKSSVGNTIANTGVVGAVMVNPSQAAPAPSPSSTTAPVKSSGGLIGASSGKRGLCYTNAAMSQIFGGYGSAVTWGYDWAQTAGQGFNAGLQYIPMLWSDASDRVASWNANANAAIAAGADSLLGFNEPDLNTQANMPVGQAVSSWQKYMQPFAGKAKLISPAVTNGGAPMGLTYLSSFISSCSGCTIDACAIHWYDSATNIQYFKDYIGEAYTACGNKPIWLTEFGASGSEAQIETFLNTVLPWLDSNSQVERYAYFLAGPSTDGTYLVNSAGNGLSGIGTIFNAA